MKIKIGDRVRHINHDFLSDGTVITIHPNFGYTVRLDEKAPNEYAWETYEVLAFPSYIEVIND